MSRKSFVRNCVKTCIADDYENFETIIEDVRRWASYKEIQPTNDEVIEALEDLIAKSEADAYALSAKPPEIWRVTYSRAHLGKLWFYVTAKGKSNILSILDLRSKN